MRGRMSTSGSTAICIQISGLELEKRKNRFLPLKTEKNGSYKEGWGEEGRSPAINKVVAQEYTINIHNCIHGMGFKNHAPRALKEICQLAMKEMETSDVYMDVRFSKAVWAKRIRNVPYLIRVWLSRKHNEDENLPNKLYTMVTYVPVTTFNNL
ncbi:60S ribosomal protein L31 [Tupaia chinensis]|uniref:Large ribosomal subunit protein eL31 n=1 Tax=Tupaia chinensis TaxID=246437 RepID=L9KM75_TUPCH|nr:60S ribosomal protein L31 [Tupaia chinensis]